MKMLSQATATATIEVCLSEIMWPGSSLILTAFVHLALGLLSLQAQLDCSWLPPRRV